METIGIVIGLMSATGLLTVIFSLHSIAADRKRERMESRERRRKDLSRNTVNTVLRYHAKQDETVFSDRRA